MKAKIEKARQALNKHWHEHSAGLTDLADVVCILKDIESSVEAQIEKRLKLALTTLEEMHSQIVNADGGEPMSVYRDRLRYMTERADLSVRNAIDRLEKCEIR